MSPLYADDLQSKIDEFRASNQIPAGITWLESHLQNTPDDIPARHALAEFYWATDSEEAARVEFDKILALEPDHAWALAGRGHLKHKAEDNAAAAEDLLRASRLLQNIDRTVAVELLLAGSRCRLAGRNWNEIQRDFVAAGDELGWPDPLIRFLVEEQTRSGNTGTLKDILTHITTLADHSGGWQARLQWASSTGDDLEPLISTARQQFPDDLELLALSATTLLSLKQYTKAVTLIRQAPPGFSGTLPELRFQGRQADILGDHRTAATAWKQAWQVSGTPIDREAFLNSALPGGDTGPVFLSALREKVTECNGAPDHLSEFLESVLKTHDYRLAQRMVNVVADLFPWQGGWPQLQTRVQLAAGDRPGAIATFEQAIETEHPDPILYLEISQLYYESGMTAEDRLILTRGTGLFPELRGQFFALAVEHGYTSLAETIWPQLRQASDDFRLRKLLYDLNPDRFLAFFMNIPHNQRDMDLVLTAAEILCSIKQTTEAETLLQSVLETNPGQQRALLALGRISLERAEFDTAETLLKQALEAGEPEAAGWLGRLKYTLGDDADAIKWLTRALQLKPAQSLLQILALAQLRNRNVDGFQQTVRNALKSGIRVPGFLLDQMPADTMEDAAGILPSLTDMDSIVIRFRLARIAQKRNDFPMAIQRFQQINDLIPGQCRIRFHLGECLLAAGQSTEARLYFQEALDGAIDLAAAEERDRILDDPYPCLTTILSGAAIAIGRDPDAIRFLRSQCSGFLNGTTDLATDNDVMRGDVTFYPYFLHRFQLQGRPAEAREFIHSNRTEAIVLKELVAGSVDPIRMKKLADELETSTSAEADWLKLFLLQESGQIRKAFAHLDTILASSTSLEVPARLMAAVAILNAGND